MNPAAAARRRYIQSLEAERARLQRLLNDGPRTPADNMLRSQQLVSELRDEIANSRAARAERQQQEQPWISTDDSAT